MSIATAKAGLVTFGATVAKVGGGTLTSYDLTTFSAAGSAVVLPCLVAMQALEESVEWTANAMFGGASTMTFVLDHYLLVAKVAGDDDFIMLEPTIVAYEENYFAALDALPYLTATSAPSIHYAPAGTMKIERRPWPVVGVCHSLHIQLTCKVNR